MMPRLRFHRGYAKVALTPAQPRRFAGHPCQDPLPPIGGRTPPDGRLAGSWMAVAVALPPLSVISALTRSPTLIAEMLVTLPVTFVEPVTVAVTLWLPSAIVIE